MEPAHYGVEESKLRDCRLSEVTQEGRHMRWLAIEMKKTTMMQGSWAAMVVPVVKLAFCGDRGEKKFPQNISCCGSHPDSSLLVVVSSTVSITSTSTISHGTYNISLWQWCRQSGLQQVSSSEFEGLYTKTKGYTDQMSSPKVVFSPQGEFIATVDNDNEVPAALSMSPMYPWSPSSRREQGDQRRWMGTKGEIDGVKSELRTIILQKHHWRQIDGEIESRRRRREQESKIGKQEEHLKNLVAD
ncbi:hypothetical protein L1887_07508 [Cichorium endivia]|nr:hypothetical protein L1887_07508 [Cichorium endivia]